VQEIIDAGEPWTDPDFPPNPSSFDDARSDIPWARVEEMYPDFKVFKNGIHPDDINQGGIGNCYFHAAMSALAEDPRRIKARIKTQKKNKAGCYLVTLFVNGEETPIILDDYFPWHGWGPNPYAGGSKSHEIWAMLLEKAWAKLHGNYGRTTAG